MKGAAHLVPVAATRPRNDTFAHKSLEDPLEERSILHGAEDALDHVQPVGGEGNP